MLRLTLAAAVVGMLAAPASAIEMFTNFDNGTQIGLPPMQVPVAVYPGMPAHGGYGPYANVGWGYRGDEFGYKFYGCGSGQCFLGHAGFGYTNYGNGPCRNCMSVWDGYCAEKACRCGHKGCRGHCGRGGCACGMAGPGCGPACGPNCGTPAGDAVQGPPSAGANEDVAPPPPGAAARAMPRTWFNRR